MKKVICFYFLICTIGLFSQTDCATEMTPDVREWFDKWDGTRQHFKAKNSVTQFVPVHIHLVGDDNGNGYLNKADAYQLICTVNKHYAVMNIICFLEGPITYIDSTVYYSHTQPYGQQMITLKNVPNVCNIYVVNYAAGACGYAFFPNSGPAGGKGGIVLKKTCALPNSTTLAHEMGHYFSLPHTFQDWNTSNAEFVDGSNCATKGDKFCDTPADWQDFRWDCPYTGTHLDPQNQPYNPDQTLFMGYAKDYCQNKFSPMQQSAIIFSRMNDRPYLNTIPVPSFSPLAPANLLSPVNNATNVPSNNNAYFSWNKVAGAKDYNFRIKLSTVTSFSAAFINVCTTDTFYYGSGFSTGYYYNWKVLPVSFDQTCIYPDSSSAQTNTFTVVFADAITENQSEIANLNLYPNPSSSQLTIEMELHNTKDASIEINTLQGKIVYQKKINALEGNNKITMPVEFIADGLYMITIYTNESKTNRKWIKLKQ